MLLVMNCPHKSINFHTKKKKHYYRIINKLLFSKIELGKPFSLTLKYLTVVQSERSLTEGCFVT